MSRTGSGTIDDPIRIKIKTIDFKHLARGASMGLWSVPCSANWREFDDVVARAYAHGATSDVIDVIHDDLRTGIYMIQQRIAHLRSRSRRNRPGSREERAELRESLRLAQLILTDMCREEWR